MPIVFILVFLCVSGPLWQIRLFCIFTGLDWEFAVKMINDREAPRLCLRVLRVFVVASYFLLKGTFEVQKVPSDLEKAPSEVLISFYDMKIPCYLLRISFLDMKIPCYLLRIHSFGIKAPSEV